MIERKNRIKETISYLFILCLTILTTSLTASAGIADWFISSGLAIKIMVIVIVIVVGLIIVLVVLIKSGVLGQALERF